MNTTTAALPPVRTGLHGGPSGQILGEVRDIVIGGGSIPGGFVLDLSWFAYFR